jgi:hypothetical protein
MRGQVKSLLVGLIIALILIWAIGTYINKGRITANEGLNQLTPNKLKLQIQNCEQTKTTENPAKPLTDDDQDGLPDICDPCVSLTKTKEVYVQNDADYLPDACDASPTVTDPSPIVACCGKDVKGKTLVEQRANCPRLVENGDIFRCAAK